MSHQVPIPARPAAKRVLPAVVITVSSVVTCVLLGVAIVHAVALGGGSMLFARAAGITSYLLLVALVMTGLTLSRPRRGAAVRRNTAARIRAHVSLAAFTGVFTVLHVVMWATDDDGGVGWRGVLLPMGSSYRPLPVSFGVLGLYSGLAAGLTAALAGRLSVRVWWPIHKVAVVSLLLVWAHALGGIDAPALIGLYVVTGLAVIGLGTRRHAVPHVRRDVARLAAVPAVELPPARVPALAGGTSTTPRG
jgi:hypothetical protein